MKKTGKKRFIVGALVCSIVLALALPIAAMAAALQIDYSWYRGKESASSYTIENAGQLSALAKLVNGTADYNGDGAVDAAVSFEGKTINLVGGTFNYLGNPIEPIGTAAHPFQGTVNGAGTVVDNFILTSSAPAQNVGLFGYVGSNGSLSNITIGARSIITVTRDASSTDYIANVGMLAGYCGGTISGCTNKGSLTVSSAVLQKNKDDFLCVRNVGGVAGQCVFDMTNCSNTGSVSVSQTSSPVADYEHAQLVARVGGVVGLLGDESRIGNYETHIYGEAGKHGSLSNCSNTGRITIDTPKLSGLDRFGERTNAESVYIGGVVGYSQGSIANCTNGLAKSASMADNGQNTGYIKAENGVMVGGVCGSLRGVLADNTNIAWADDGADGNDPLVISGCMNYGDVYGRVTVGGIVGKTSSYTTVTECLNSTKRDYFGNEVSTYVIATRWNKPSPAGIVGTANGEVSYCANLATVASATWSNEENRTYTTQDGYYAAGIVGMLTYFDDRAPSHGGVTTPISEVFSCYNAGTIVAGANMRQRGIVGENDGYTHDNVLVAGVVYNDDVVYGDTDDESEASGAVGENRVYGANDLRGSKAAEAIAFLNGNSEANGWTCYWLVPRETGQFSLNKGYPLLDSQNPWGADAVLITDASTRLLENASYTGGVSVPSVEVKLVVSGTEVTLTENADYRVIPQAGAIQPSTGGAYEATVVGLGRYQGTAQNKVAYDIVAGDFAKCKLTAVAHTFDFSAQIPSAQDITIRTPAGTTVDPAEYTFKLVDANDDEIANPTNADTYTVMAVPKENSTLFTGSVKGTWRIKPASFVRDVKLDGTKISYLGTEYPWVDSGEKGESDNPKTTLRYTGSPVKPTVGTITYNGHDLVEGTDYRVVYGNSNSDDGYMGDQDEYNVGKKGGRSIGCVTVRYISGQKTNFTSYANMFFNIVDDGQKTDISKAHGKVEGEQVSDGQPIEPVEVWLDRTKLEKGVDYQIEYRDNVNPGTATYQVTGMGQFEGSFIDTFEILEGSVYEFSYTYAGDGSASAPYEATVTGVEYKSSRPLFDMVIPETVEHDGHVYTVTAIADNAFGGPSNSDFKGTLANESKMKIRSAFIPATVRSIGSCAFGTSSPTMYPLPPIASVEFGAGSQLESIGGYAFAQCENITRFTFPANVATIADKAFYGCKGIAELRFLTTAADLPSSIGGSSFYYCDNVVVRGFESATAVRAFAQANASSKRVENANGGKSFTFLALTSIATAVISDVPDQEFTGSAIKPQVTVTLNGRRLFEGTDYAISYENNVNAGVGRVVVTGIGDMGSQAVRTFNIKPVQIGRSSFTRLADQEYTGQPVALEPTLSFKNHTLKRDIDYSLSYADASGNAISAPFSAGSYRLVATGKGNFTGTTYRAFSIVAQKIENSSVGAIGQQVYTGVALEPDPTVTVAGKVLARDVDYTLAFENNVAVGEGTVHVYGIGGYEGEATANFQIIAAGLTSAKIANVYDVQQTGSAVAFDPVVIVDGVRLVRDTDYTVSYERVDQMSGQSLGTQGVGEGEGGDSADAQDADADVADAQGAGGAGAQDADNVDGSDVKDTGGAQSVVQSTQGIAPATTQGELVAQGLEVAEINNPTEVGSYKVVITGKGNYAGVAQAAFAITVDPPAAKTDLSTAGNVQMQLAIAQGGLAYDGTAQKPGATLTVGGNQLTENTDFVVAYANNVSPGESGGASAPIATAYGIGSYTGSVSQTFSIASAAITADCVSAIGAQEYTASAIKPHLVVKVGARSLVEGTDYTVEYGTNTVPGVGTATVKAVAPNFTGEVPLEFNIVKADVSGALIKLEYDSARYAGKPMTPGVTVTHRGRVLDAATEYDVAYANNVDSGIASVTVTGKGDYCTGTATVNFRIDPIEVQKPTAQTGLVYTGGTLVGVKPSAGLVITGGSAVNVGTYTATVVPANGYAWPGGFKSPVTLTYTIAPASLANAAVSLTGTSFTYNGGVQQPGILSVKAGSLEVPASGYTASIPSSVDVGTYTVTITGVGNFRDSVTATYTIGALSIAKAKITLSKTAFTFNNKVQKPTVKLVKVGSLAVPAWSYAASIPSSKKAGKYTVTVTGKGNFTGRATASYSIAKAAQKLVVKAKSPKVSLSKLKKKAQVVKIGSLVKITGAKTTKTYAKVKGSSARLTVNKKTGAVTVKKKTKKGTYTLKLKVSVAANVNYKAASKTVTVKIKVK